MTKIKTKEDFEYFEALLDAGEKMYQYYFCLLYTSYITRFFFVSAGGAKRNDGDTPNKTVGSLLDNVKFEQEKAYTIEYYVDGVKQDNLTVTGRVNPYDRVSIPCLL